MEENKTYLDANEFETYDDIDEIETKILGSTVFADLLSDAGFKTIFTCRDNEDLLVDLINVMLQGERTVKSIKLKPTEFVPSSNGGKKSVVDLCAVDDKGVSFDLEVQRCSEDDLFKSSSASKRHSRISSFHNAHASVLSFSKVDANWISLFHSTPYITRYCKPFSLRD